MVKNLRFRENWDSSVWDLIFTAAFSTLFVWIIAVYFHTKETATPCGPSQEKHLICYFSVLTGVSSPQAPGWRSVRGLGQSVRMATEASSLPSPVVHQINKQFLICSICLDRYNNPKVLPCLHTFCEKYVIFGTTLYWLVFQSDQIIYYY